MATEAERRAAHEALKKRRLDERRATIRRQVEKVGNKPGTYPGRSGNPKTSAVHAGGPDDMPKTERRAKAQKARLTRKDRALTKAEPRGPTKAAKNIANAGKLARGANLVGAAAAYGGLIADTVNPETPEDYERQRLIAELMRREEFY